jgi:acyl-CoA dehydrogenase
LTIAERIEVIAPHPLARIELASCRVPRDALLGAEGEGMKLALRTLDIFRASVAAAGAGFRPAGSGRSAGTGAPTGRCSAPRSPTRSSRRRRSPKWRCRSMPPRCLTYAAAWLRDVKGARATKEAAMAKWSATESAQDVIDKAVQMFGALGVTAGRPSSRLYREIRALRIYEGATDVQKLVVARELLRR